MVNKVCKNFGGLRALRDVCLEVEAGEHRVIIGPNGAGKTTLFNIISGIEPTTSGAVNLFGKDICRLPLRCRVDLGVSQTFQLINLFRGLTVLENVVLAVQSFKRVSYNLYRPLTNYRHVIDQAERLLTEWALLDRRYIKVSHLSYGDQRLLDIMLALASSPRLLLLDEPTSGLPLADIEAVTSKINNLSREVTVLIIEHNMDVALSLADRVTVLHMGQVMAEGTPAKIREDTRVKSIYLGTEKELERDTGSARDPYLLRG